MPQQLIYTSAARGIVAGRSGHCTVARSAAMREPLVLQLEKWSYYQHLSLSGGQERPIHACRTVDIRGSRFHVLSRIQDAGLDFTGRTNFVAHHLVFTPAEARRLPSPPVILRGWYGWVRLWATEPQLLENEDWSGLAALMATLSVPAETWRQVTGDAVNGYGMLEVRPGTAFRADDLPDDTVLSLLAESLELLELRDPRRDFRASAWNYTFTTSMQEQDNPTDFRWRCLHSDNPASSRLAGPDCPPLSAVRVQRSTDEEASLARSGRQTPRFVTQPQSLRVIEGEEALFQAQAEGIPSPNYQWFVVDRAGNLEIIATGIAAELVVPNPPFGLSRYLVVARNSQGEATSDVATLSVEQKLRLAAASGSRAPGGTSPDSPMHQKSAEDIDRQRRRLQEAGARAGRAGGWRRKAMLLVLCASIVAGVAVWFVWKRSQSKAPPPQKEIVQPEGTPTQGQGEPSGNTSAPNNQSLQQGQDLLLGWTNVVVGTGSSTNTVLAADGKFLLEGSGTNIHLLGTNDSFLFAFTTNSDVSEFTAQILEVSDGTDGTRCGLMMRKSAQADAPFVFIGVSAKLVFFVTRDIPGGRNKQQHAAVTNQDVILKLTRMDTAFSGSYSINGTNWITFATNIIPALQVPCLVGFAVCSGQSTKPVRAIFSKFELRPSNLRSP